MRLYHFVSSQWGLEDIQKRRLKIATIPDLNDPFELIAFSTANPQVEDALLTTKKQLGKANGILCFSEDWSNPVQWSHYAERQKGICLGFDVPDHIPMKVAYVDTRLDSNLLFATEAEAYAAVKLGIVTKFSHWSYEREWRIWINIDLNEGESGKYFEPFPPSLSLREVIIGHESELTRGDIQHALGEELREVAIYRATLAREAFRVDKGLEIAD